MKIQSRNDRVDPATAAVNAHGREGKGVMKWRRSAGRRSFIREYAWQGINQGESSKPGASVCLNITQPRGMIMQSSRF